MNAHSAAKIIGTIMIFGGLTLLKDFLRCIIKSIASGEKDTDFVTMRYMQNSTLDEIERLRVGSILVVFEFVVIFA